MPDLTTDFYAILKSRHAARSLAHEGAPNNANISATSILRKKRRKSHSERGDAFLKEAYRLLEHVNQLRYFLLRARKYYLDTGRHVTSAKPLSEGELATDEHYARQKDTLPLLKMLPQLKNMTDKQRVELDMQTQILVETFLKRVAVLSQLGENLSNAPPKPAFLLSFLSTDEDLHQRMLREHRNSVIWLLRKRLMDVSNIQKDMQERLMQRRLSREDTYFYKGVNATKTRPTPLSPATAEQEDAHDLSLAQLTSKLTSSLTGGNPTPLPRSKSSSAESLDQRDSRALALQERVEDNDVASQLEPQERQLLESENAALLEELESSIDQVRETTQSLNVISSLHSRLSHELQSQSETIGFLYDDAWRSTESVKNANLQLISAQKHFGDARIWVLLFLVIASAILWFLDYYG
ncbi:uncharacterized protein SPPG_06157 [Spizellomyces punctatus DAOM BR117]|uniref:SNARE-complex protein Syntaxin-18 N-terminal domain-containing protein n=1 Tax=Spizellomyces punctatus (strain DAOM BR117) TaxID=645134 RepID=A0A0L0HB68_SPIPD|nr:uncharacterized protein SPPG_06157 [Spizellomyces punctatus DAOM BR117]KNC98457.1 hypothetical protein SPPG_06157 [Spizellomyces punctatus DAOM BR117]|eukprot:XP_016606497.1 hypothetical protein SPPG_06157 [Spizellomyces punctatus DAOM BR117]